MDEKPASSSLPPEPSTSEPTPTEPKPESSPAESFTPPPPPPATTIPDPSMPKKRGLKAVMIAIVAVAALGAAGAFAYFGVYVPNQPENVVKTALGNLLAADSASLRGTAQLSWSNFTVNPVFNAEVAQDGGAAFGVRANLGGVDLGLEARQTADDVYLKADGLSGLGTAWQDSLLAYGFSQEQVATLNDLVNSIEGKWIVVNDVVKSGQNNLPNIEPDQLSAAFGDKDIIASAEKVGEENIESRSASHFKVTFNKDELKAGIDALNAEGLDDERKSEIKEAIDELRLTDVDIWVYDDSKEFAKVTSSGSLGETSSEGTYQFEVIFISFNQSLSIETPTDALSGAELWLDLNNSLQLDQLYQETLQDIPTGSFEEI